MRTKNKVAVSPRLSLCSGLVRLLVCCTSVFFGCREQPSDSDRMASSDIFSVAFYNVENLYDNEFDGYEYPEYRPEATNWNQQMHATKFENIASVLVALNASIVGLCEVEDRDALGQLIDKLKEKELIYPYYAIVDTPVRASNCPALLSQFPVKKYTAIPVALPDSVATRPVLEVDVKIGEIPLKIFVNHWPSKFYPESFRLSAANTLIDRIKQLPKGSDYVVIGDFNSDYDEFSTFTTFGKNNTKGITGINHCLGTVRKITQFTERPRTEREMLAESFPSHYDCWLELPDAIRMSYVFRGNNQTPDHILLPPSLYDSSGINYVDNSFESFTWGSRLIVNGKPLRWQMNRKGKKKYHAGKGYSDHLPIIAKFFVKPFSFTPSIVDNPDSLGNKIDLDGWFEYHTNGWVSTSNTVKYTRSTLHPYIGKYALNIVTSPNKTNRTIMQTVVPGGLRDKDGGILIYIRGNGTICFRTRESKGKWSYHNILKGTRSGRATYTPVAFDQWYSVTLYPTVAKKKCVALELRTGKNASCNLWLDR